MKRLVGAAFAMSPDYMRAVKTILSKMVRETAFRGEAPGLTGDHVAPDSLK